MHWQVPATHCWPTAQAAPVPHLHIPVDPQVSARSVSHAVHATPLTPHWVTLGALQVEPVQHPFGQVVAVHPLHAPALQVSPLGHT